MNPNAGSCSTHTRRVPTSFNPLQLAGFDPPSTSTTTTVVRLTQLLNKPPTVNLRVLRASACTSYFRVQPLNSVSAHQLQPGDNMLPTRVTAITVCGTNHSCTSSTAVLQYCGSIQWRFVLVVRNQAETTIRIARGEPAGQLSGVLRVHDEV